MNVRAVDWLVATAASRTSSDRSVDEMLSRWAWMPLTPSCRAWMVWLISGPLPWSAVGPWLMNRSIAFVAFFEPAIPVAKSLSEASTWSKSTGVRVRSSGISAPSSIVGPLRVDRRQLDVPVGGDRPGDDDGAGVGRDVVVVVDLHGDLDLVAVRLDRR